MTQPSRLPPSPPRRELPHHPCEADGQDPAAGAHVQGLGPLVQLVVQELQSVGMLGEGEGGRQTLNCIITPCVCVSVCVYPSYHVWSTDGCLEAFGFKQTQVGLVQHCWGVGVGGVNGGGTSTRTYGLGRVHVGVTPGEVGSVRGQHDFVDLVRLNDAVFCKQGGRGKKVSLGIMGSGVPAGRLEDCRLHNDAADAETQRATFHITQRLR